MDAETKKLLEENRLAYAREERLASSILKRNRHNSVTGEWYGPDEEKAPAGPYDCNCCGCFARFYPRAAWPEDY